MRLLLTAVATIAAVAALPAQVFEVASVKPNKSGDTAVSFRLQPGGRLNALNVTVRDLVRFAYVVQPFLIEGGPGWIDSDRFDVVAKVAGEIVPVPPGQMGPVQKMMQNLLAERFALKVRRETKDAPAYALVLGRSDRRLGPQITPSIVDCAALLRAQFAGGRGGPPTAPGGGQQCRLSTAGSGSVMARDVSIPQLAQLLSGQLQRHVLDVTELTGLFSFDLSFATDQIERRRPALALHRPPGTAGAEARVAARAPGDADRRERAAADGGLRQFRIQCLARSPNQIWREASQGDGGTHDCTITQSPGCAGVLCRGCDLTSRTSAGRQAGGRVEPAGDGRDPCTSGRTYGPQRGRSCCGRRHRAWRQARRRIRQERCGRRSAAVRRLPLPDRIRHQGLHRASAR